MASPRVVRAAVIQPAGHPFNSLAAVEAVHAWTSNAARDGAELVLFPEAYVGGYPWGLTFGASIGRRLPEGQRAWERYLAGAIDVPGPRTDALGTAARDASVHLAVGVIERDSTWSGGTLYCTLLYFGPDGRLLGKHRKLKPTAAERLVWGEGDGSTLTAVNTPLGTIGGLICWENYMPLARMAMYAKGVEIYLAPTADARERWQSTLRHIALEGRCFVLGCNQFVSKADYPRDLEVLKELDAWPDPLCRGGSAIYSPSGDCVAGPLWDKEGMLVADLDMGEIARGKFDFDVTGHYARADVFRLDVNEAPMPPVDFKAPPD